MPVTRKQEIWALALSVERKHGGEGQCYIDGRIATFKSSGPPEAVALWKQVSRSWKQLHMISDNVGVKGMRQ